jgi:hypothetical protein
MRGFLQGCRSRGLKRRPLLQTSSPLKPKKSGPINQLGDSHRGWYSKRGHFRATTKFTTRFFRRTWLANAFPYADQAKARAGESMYYYLSARPVSSTKRVCRLCLT